MAHLDVGDLWSGGSVTSWADARAEEPVNKERAPGEACNVHTSTETGVQVYYNVVHRHR